MTLAEALALMQEIIAVYEGARDRQASGASRYAGRMDVPGDLCVATTDGQTFKVQYLYWHYSDSMNIDFESVEDWHKHSDYQRYAREEGNG